MQEWLWGGDRVANKLLSGSATAHCTGTKVKSNHTIFIINEWSSTTTGRTPHLPPLVTSLLESFLQAQAFDNVQ